MTDQNQDITEQATALTQAAVITRDAIQSVMKEPDCDQVLIQVIQQTGLTSRETFAYPVPVLPDGLPEQTEQEIHRSWHNVQACVRRLYRNPDIMALQDRMTEWITAVQQINKLSEQNGTEQ